MLKASPALLASKVWLLGFARVTGVAAAKASCVISRSSSINKKSALAPRELSRVAALTSSLAPLFRIIASLPFV